MIVLASAHAQLLERAIRAAQAASDLPAFEIPAIEIKPPKRPEQGDYAASIALQLAKPAAMKPLDVANIIVRHLPPADFVSSVEVAPPGFINFRLSDDWLRQQVEVMIAAGENLFQLDIGKGKRAQVEFVSANPTGPLHIGRSRGAIVGDSIARILEAASYSVEREYYFNNAGMQMQNLGKSMRYRYLEALGLPPQPGDELRYEGEYLVEFAQELVQEHGKAWVDSDWKP
ncbi:MAG TPA: arginine--tRNA ligase, partial [Spirillospora sp.]|nr:arginine--tRNA ligase [Spirillospora sp.]